MSSADKLAELERARKAREKAREDAAAEAATAAAIRNEERLARLEEAVDAAVRAHGPIGKKLLVVHAAYPDGEIVGSIILHGPSPVVWKRFKAETRSTKESERDAAEDRLWRACLATDEALANDLVERFPGLPSELVGAVIQLAGFGTSEVQKK